MQWVFDLLVGWLLEKLVGCFSVVSSMLFTFFNLDRKTFDTFFNFFGNNGSNTNLYDLIRALGFAVCMLIVIVRLLSNLLSSITEEYEDPIKLAFRAILGFILVAISPAIVDIEFQFMQKPYNAISKVMNTSLKNSGGMKATVWTSFAKSVTDGLKELKGDGGVVDEVVLNILTIGCLFAIFSAFLKLALEVAERYVVICISIYLAPLAFATAASKNTVRIMQSYIRMVFCQLLLMIFNVIFVDGTVIAVYNFTKNGGKVALSGGAKTMPVFIFCVLLLAFITAGQRMDSYMRAIGLDTVQTGSLFDEIRGGLMAASNSSRAIGNAVHAAGSFGKAVASGISTITGRTAPGSSGNGRGGSTSPIKENVANASRSAAATMAQNMSQMGGSAQNIAQKAAQNQIRSGAFNGLAGESNKSIQKAVETAIGARAMQKMGIDPSTLVGKNGQIDFKAKNGASGSLSFTPKEGNGWKELKDGHGKGLGAWVKGSDNLGISSALAGTHEKLSAAFGSQAGAAVAGAILGGKTGMAIAGQKINPSSLEAVAQGNGEFSVIGRDGLGNAVSLGRVVPMDAAKNTAGAIMAENEFGGRVGFIPETNVEAAMKGKFVDDAMVSLGNGTSVPTDSLRDAFTNSGKLEANNISEGTAMLGFNSDGNTYTASFADPVSGTREVSGNVSELLGNMDPGDAMASLSDGFCASPADIKDALSDSMQANGISDGASLIGFSTDGSSFTASFSGENGEQSVSGSMSQLLDNMDEGALQQGSLSDLQDGGMIGLSSGIAVSESAFKDAISPELGANGISSDADLLGYSYDSKENTYTASFESPEGDTRSISGNLGELMGRLDNDSVAVGLSDGISASSADIRDAVSHDTDGITANSQMTGFESDGKNYTATFDDPENGTRSVSGNIRDLAGNIGEGNIRNQKLSDCEWVGMNDLFDTRAYSAMTGETPNSIEYNPKSSDNNTSSFIVTNESGSQFVISQAASTGRLDRVIAGGDVLNNVPLSVQRFSNKQKQEDSSDNRQSGSGKSGFGGKFRKGKGRR